MIATATGIAIVAIAVKTAVTYFATISALSHGSFVGSGVGGMEVCSFGSLGGKEMLANASISLIKIFFMS
jgi:hypothetical protein